MRRILFVHAHPDDETITTGGAIARYLAEGAEVLVVTCTLGEEGEVIGAQWAGLAVVLGDGTVQEIVSVPGTGPRDPDDPALAPLAGRLLRLLGVPFAGRRSLELETSPTRLASSLSPVS